MAHFYGSMRGNKGEVTRAGSKSSGLGAHIRGWNFGARININEKEGQDVVRIVLTSGSNGNAGERLIGEFTQDDL